MAGVGGRAAATLSRQLARLRFFQSARITQGHAAFLHTTPALDAGIFDMDEDDETGTYMDGLLHGLSDMAVHYSPEIKESTPQPTPTHHRKTLLGSEKEPQQMKHESVLTEVSVPPVMDSSSNIHSAREGFVIETKNSKMMHIGDHEVIHKEMQLDKLTRSSHEHPTLISSTTHEEEMVQLQKDQLESIGEELPSLEDLPAATEQLNSLQEDYNIGVSTRIMPIEAVSHVDSQPIDLSSDLTQIQKENLETFAADVIENNTDLNSSFDMAEEYYKTSEVEVANQAAQNEHQARDVDRSPYPEPPVAGGACVEEQEEGAGSLTTMGTSSVPQVPDDSKDVKVGTLIALMVAEGEDWKTVEMPSTEEGAAPLPTTTTEAAPKKAAEGEADHGNFGPSVRLLLKQYGLKADDVPHGGPHGILVKGDVLRLIKERNLKPKALESVPPPKVSKHAAAAAAAPSQTAPPPPPPSTTPGDGYVDVEVTNMRRTIAKRLTQSKTGIAHSYATMECCMDNLLNLRKQYKAEGVNVSVNDLIIKAVAVALSRCPEMNCVWEGNQLKSGGPVDISVAVATPAGLITPIVRGADTRGLEDIAATVRDLATRAKENKLKLDEFQGGTFTISNLGMFGIREFSAIINPPQCGILAVGGSRLVPDESGVPVTLMASQLSYDRSAVDDFVAAEFLGALKTILENPKTILLGSYASQPHPLAALL